MNQPSVAAIDGGGTKTAFVRVSRDGTVLRSLTLGPSNPFDIGLDACGQVIREGLTALLENSQIDGLFAGLAGAVSGDASEKLNAMLASMLPRTPCRAGSDMVNAIASGSLSGDGCAVIAGTGSSCFARVSGVLYRSGGWGYLFDGAGSGYDLGAGAIAHTLRVTDGRVPPSPLSRLTTLALKGSPAEKLSEIYAGGKRFIASLAPVVFEAADARDAAALSLLDRTGEHLGEIIRSACEKAGLFECKVVCVGGLWNRRDLLEPRVLAYLPEGLTLQYPTVPPVFGAACEACRLAGWEVTEAFRTKFKETYHPGKD